MTESQGWHLIGTARATFRQADITRATSAGHPCRSAAAIRMTMTRNPNKKDWLPAIDDEQRRGELAAAARAEQRALEGDAE